MARGEPFWLLALLALFGDKAKKKPVVVVAPPPPSTSTSTPASPFPNLGDLLAGLGKLKPGAPAPKPSAGGAAPKPSPAGAPKTTLAKTNGPLPTNAVRISVTHAPSDVATWIVAVRDSGQLGTWDWTRDAARPEYIVRSEPQASGVNVLVLYGISHAGEGTPSGKGRGGT